MSGSGEEECGGPRILVVDDDPAIRRLVRDMLEQEHHTVVVAGTVASALAEIAANPGFDAAVLDVGLPDGEGFEILEHLRTGTRPCAAVLMTGQPDEPTVARSIGIGVHGFLPKPYRRLALLEAVRGALELTQVWRNRVSNPGGTSTIAAGGGMAPPPAPVLGNGRNGAELALARDEASRILAELTADGGLTEREQETLELVLVGASNPEIGASLGISANTAKYHVKNLLSKLELESRSDLLRFLAERGS